MQRYNLPGFVSESLAGTGREEGKHIVNIDVNILFLSNIQYMSILSLHPYIQGNSFIHHFQGVLT